MSYWTSQNQTTCRGYIPDPEKPGWMIYDEKEYLKTLRLEAKSVNAAMRQIINNRSTINE